MAVSLGIQVNTNYWMGRIPSRDPASTLLTLPFAPPAIDCTDRYSLSRPTGPSFSYYCFFPLSASTLPELFASSFVARPRCVASIVRSYPTYFEPIVFWVPSVPTSIVQFRWCVRCGGLGMPNRENAYSVVSFCGGNSMLCYR